MVYKPGDARKVSDEDLENIGGGRSLFEGFENLSELKKERSTTKEINCAGCGKMITVTDYSKIPMDLIGFEYSRLLHYNKYCEDCKKDHLWPGDTYDKETGRIIKDKLKF